MVDLGVQAAEVVAVNGLQAEAKARRARSGIKWQLEVEWCVLRALQNEAYKLRRKLQRVRGEIDVTTYCLGPLRLGKMPAHAVIPLRSWRPRFYTVITTPTKRSPAIVWRGWCLGWVRS